MAAAVARHRRPRPVGRQLDLIRQVLQRLRPERQLPRQRAARRRSHRPAPPAATACSRRTAPAAATVAAATPWQPRPVQRRQVPRQRTERPAVARDVMQHAAAARARSRAHSSNRCARSGSSRDRSKPRPAAAVSAAARPASSTAPISSRSRADSGGRISCRGTPSRSGNTVRRLSCRSTRSPSAASSAARSSAPLQPHRQRDHIGAADPLQPLQEPQPPLRIGQRDLGRPRLHRHQRRAVMPPPPTTAAAASAATLGASNRLRIATSTFSAARIRLISRVASSECPPQLEEVVVDADPLDPEHLGKQRAQDLLLRRPRRPMRMRRPKLRRRQRPAVELAVRRQRQPLQHHQRRRHHVVRQLPRQRRPQRRGVQHRARRRHHVADQPLAARAVLPRDHRGLRHARPAAASTASISPGSIRNPRSFTCASARPRNSSTPSDRHRARSPVRYIRLAAQRRHAGRRRTAPPSAPARFR